MIKIYSLRDSKSGHFGKPIMAPHHAPLIREFSDSVNNPETMYSKFPGDFDLFEIGDFDHISGQITPTAQPLHLICLSTLKTQEAKNG